LSSFLLYFFSSFVIEKNQKVTILCFFQKTRDVGVSFDKTIISYKFPMSNWGWAWHCIDVSNHHSMVEFEILSTKTRLRITVPTNYNWTIRKVRTIDSLNWQSKQTCHCELLSQSLFFFEKESTLQRILSYIWTSVIVHD
jgi:hypothetical protein